MRVSIIVPLFNQLGFTKVCLEYLDRNTPKEGVELILVDNASSDGTREFTAGLRNSARVLRNESNLGFAKACNQGAREARGEFLIFLNNDTAPHKGWLDGLLDPFAVQPNLGITGPKLVYPDGTVQQAGVVFSANGLPYHLYTGCAAHLAAANRRRFFRSVTGACFAIRKAEFLAHGGFDERYINGLEDIDLCLKVDASRKGILYNPASVVTHFESRSENRQARMDDNARLFVATHGNDGVRCDDFRYLNQDGMGIWVTPEQRIEFYALEELALRCRPDFIRAGNLARAGDPAKALAQYREILARVPYSTEALQGVADIARSVGLKDLHASFSARAAELSSDWAGYGSEMLPPLATVPAPARAGVTA